MKESIVDQQHIEAVTRTLTRLPSRRDVLRGLAAAGLGLGSLRLSKTEAAKHKSKANKKKGKKRKHKHQSPPITTPQDVPPLVFNKYGCVNVGQPCRGDSTNCCSGICQGAAPATGQPDTSRCIAHDTGTCQQEATGLCLSDAPPNLSCNNNAGCRCFTSTAGSNVCGTFNKRACAACQRDADCTALGFPAGSACAPFSEGFCGGQCASGMICIIPCGIELPPPPPDM